MMRFDTRMNRIWDSENEVTVSELCASVNEERVRQRANVRPQNRGQDRLPQKEIVCVGGTSL